MTPLDDYRTLLRGDLGTFVQRAFAELFPATTLEWNWHIDAMVAKLDACRRGEIRRLIINVPPRSLKSLCCSVAFPAFVLGHDPTAQLICASYGQDLADKLARDTRTVMQSRWYEGAFGRRLAAARPSLQEIVTTDHGVRLATSVGGVLTGRGGDFLIVDDREARISRPQAQGDRPPRRWQPRTVLIEDKASGIHLIQDLRHDGLHAVTPYKPQTEKVMRLLAQTPTIEQGRVHLPDHAPWRAAYIHELTSFPKARHDDQADSTAQALEWLAKDVPNHGLLRYAQQELRRMRAGG